MVKWPKSKPAPPPKPPAEPGLTIKELKQILGRFKLKTSGNKAELEKRLLDHRRTLAGGYRTPEQDEDSLSDLDDDELEQDMATDFKAISGKADGVPEDSEVPPLDDL